MRIRRLFLLVLTFAFLIIMVHTVVYGSILTKSSELTISNSMFIIGIMAFLPTFALRIGSANLFLGFRYSIYQVVFAGRLKEYNSLSEFASDKQVTPKGEAVNEILFISLSIIIASYVLVLNWSP